MTKSVKDAVFLVSFFFLLFARRGFFFLKQNLSNNVLKIESKNGWDVRKDGKKLISNWFEGWQNAHHK